MMKKILILKALILLCSFSNAQIFKNGTKMYKTILDTWETESYESFLSTYPTSKYRKEITQRLICKQRNNAFYKVSISSDTNELKSYLNNYDTCTFCKTYLPTFYLNHLSVLDDDLITIKDSLESKRALYFWRKEVIKGGPTNYLIVAQFITKYPNSFLNRSAQDSLYARKDLSFWKGALMGDNSLGYKLYCDSMPNGIHFAEAQDLFYEYQLGEALANSKSHKELTEGIMKLRTIQPQSKFISAVMLRLQSMEQAEYSKCLKQKSLSSWINFEKKYPNGYYFKEVDKKIRDLANMSKYENRSPYGTFLELTNEYNYPISFEFSSENESKQIMRVDASQISGLIITNGTKQIRVTSLKTGEKLYDSKEFFTGTPMNFTP